MRPPGAGTVTELSPTRFWARGPRPARRPLGVYPTHAEAVDVANAAVQELASADRTRVAGVTLRAFGARHLDELEIAGDHSIDHRRARWGHVERAPFIDDPIVTIARPAVVAWIKVLGRSKVRHGQAPGGKLRLISQGTVSGIVGGLALVFDAALDEGLVAVNPARGIRKRGAKRPAQDEDAGEVWTYLDADEQRDLTTCAEVPECDRLILAFAIGTGLRQSEQWNLELRDVHLEGPRPFILVRWGSKGRKPKNGKIRTVPLFGLALDAASRWLEILPTYAPKNPERLMFPRPTGRRRAPSTHLHRGARGRVDGFRLALDAAGIERSVRWHDLRHTCASSLVIGWWGERWRLEEARDMLGHTSIRITERYAHLAEAAIGDVAARTTGLRPGDVRRAIPGGSSSDRSPKGGCGSATLLRTIPGTYAPDNPAVTRERAIEGLRALERGDLTAARLLAASGWDEAALCRIFEAVLAEAAADQPAAQLHRGRR